MKEFMATGNLTGKHTEQGLAHPYIDSIYSGT